MPKKQNINDEEVQETIIRIAEHCFKMFQEKMHEELKYLDNKNLVYNLNDLTKIIMLSLSNLEINVIMIMKKIIKEITNSERDFLLILNMYIDDLRNSVERIKEEVSSIKMN